MSADDYISFPDEALHIDSRDLMSRQQIVFVTGNGFDLACNLPTRFYDFYQNYLVRKIFKTKSFDFNKTMNTEFNVNDVADFLTENTNVSLWEIYLAFNNQKDSQKEDVLWKDVELDIQKSLDENGFWSIIKYELRDNVFDDDFGSLESNSKNKLKLILKYSLYIRYKNSIYDGMRHLNVTNFYNSLLFELNLMEKHFHDYLFNLYKNNQEYVLAKESNMEILHEKIDSVFESYSGIKDLTFNYTNFSSIGKMTCLHGDENPIIGIGNLEDVDPNLVIFSKLYRREQQDLNKYFDEIDIGDYNLVFYGVSFSETDFAEYKMLIDNMSNSGRVLILYSNYDGSDHKSETNRNASKLLMDVYGDKHLEDYYRRKEEGQIIFEKIELPHKIDNTKL